MRKKVLFISHQASRSGAPIVLLHLLRWLKEHSDLDFMILLEEAGELESEFREIAETHIWTPPAAATLWQNRWERATGKAATHQRGVARQLKKFAPDIIYANTVVAATSGIKLKQQLGCPLLCHVHELSIVIDEFHGKDHFTKLSKSIDFFVAASEAVKNNLHEAHQIPLAAIEVVYEFVPTLEGAAFEAARQHIRRQLSIAEDAFVVVGAGSIDWRKGADLFIQVAQQVGIASGPRPEFIWVGGNLGSADGRKVRHDVAHANVVGQVHFLGAQPNPYDYLSAADVFLLTSREDPYPLVCLEAAALGKPIICFANSGGMPEFVEQDCGVVVPYLRVDLLAAAILTMRDSVSLRKQLGAQAAQKMRQRHTIELAGQQVSRLLHRLSGG